MSSILGGIENALGSATQSISNSLNSAANNILQPQGPLPPYFSGAVGSCGTNVPQGYQIVFSGQDENGTPIGYQGCGYIQAFLPEQFDIATTSQWQPLLASDLTSLISAANSVIGATGNAIVQTAATGLRVVTGLTGQIPAFSQLFWTSTSPISFNLNLQFNAVVSAAAEVTANIESLLSLTLPSLSTGTQQIDGIGILKAPGPTIIQQSNGYNINLSVGANWLFSNVIIEDVGATIDTLPTSSGDYISALVHVRVSTNRIYTKQDLKAAFSNSTQSAAQLSPGQITQLTGLTQSGANSVLNTIGSAISKINTTFPGAS